MAVSAFHGSLLPRGEALVASTAVWVSSGVDAANAASTIHASAIEKSLVTKMHTPHYTKTQPCVKVLPAFCPLVPLAVFRRSESRLDEVVDVTIHNTNDIAGLVAGAVVFDHCIRLEDI